MESRRPPSIRSLAPPKGPAPAEANRADAEPKTEGPLSLDPNKAKGLRTKGTALIDLVKAARKNRAAFEAVLPRETIAFLDNYILPSSWYPEVHLRNLLTASGQVTGGGDAFCIELGRMGARKDFQGVHAARIVKGDPNSTLDKLGMIWSLYHNTGTAAVERDGDDSIYVELRGFGLPSSAVCATCIGMILEIIELAGGEEGKVEHVACRARGDDACRYHVTWRTRR